MSFITQHIFENTQQCLIQVRDNNSPAQNQLYLILLQHAIQNNDIRSLDFLMYDTSISKNPQVDTYSQQFDNVPLYNPNPNIFTKMFRYLKLCKTSVCVDGECIICYENYKYPCKLSCSHVYCWDCIHTSLKYKPICPVCKRHV